MKKLCGLIFVAAIILTAIGVFFWGETPSWLAGVCFLCAGAAYFSGATLYFINNKNHSDNKKY